MNFIDSMKSSSNCQFFLDGLAEIIGQDALSALLKIVLSNHHQDRDGIRCCDLTQITSVLESLYGSQAGKGIALRSGRASLKYLLQSFQDDLHLSEVAFRMKPSHLRFKEGLKRLIRVYREKLKIDAKLIDEGDGWIWQSGGCTECEERKSREPVCYFTEGLLQEFLSWCGGNKFYVVKEIGCRGQGERTCSYLIDPKPIE